jgi:hypothetical protein
MVADDAPGEAGNIGPASAAEHDSSDALVDGASLPEGANMTRGSASKPNGAARPIKTKKDYSAAASVVEKIAAKPNGETVAEKRLQSLLKEMEKFDGDVDDAEEGMSDGGYEGPMRRWSDESTDPD